MKKFLILSDLHLDHDGKINDDELYLYFMNYIDKNFTIILNGDILDIIKYELINFRYEYENIRIKYPKIINLLRENKNIIYIKGNHDAVLKRNDIHPNIYDEYDLEYSNFNIHFEHGSKFDIANSTCSCFGNLFARFWGCCCNNPVLLEEDFIDSLEDIENNVSHKKLKKKGFALDNDLTIFGHSHVQYIKTNHLNKTYVNTGCFSNNIMDETIIIINIKKNNIVSNIKIKQQKFNIKTKKIDIISNHDIIK